MAAVSTFIGNVLVRPCCRKTLFAFGSANEIRFSDCNAIRPLPRMVLATSAMKTNCLRNPFWLSLIKDSIWTWKSLFMFRIEQPSQLKYIEWSSFQSTLNTATLTLDLVAVLIVALSSVDSVLCYLLALFLTRTP